MGIRVESHRAEVIAAKDEAVEKALMEMGLVAEAHAKTEIANDPKRIDTGRLRNSITFAKADDTSVAVGTNVEYAEYVHEGTQRMAPNRFLKNAVEKNANEYKEIAEKWLKG